MRYKNFEDLPVWKDGIHLSVLAFELTQDNAFRQKGDIANQLQRASLSISNNIAEGFERGTTPELLQFIYYAKGSAGEVRSMCYVMERLSFLGHLKSEISDIKSRARSICKQLAAWALSMQDSDIAGVRHMTEKSKQNYHDKKKSTALMERLRKDHMERLEQMKRERQANQNNPPPDTDI